MTIGQAKLPPLISLTTDFGQRDSGAGQWLAYVGSSPDHIEIAIREGNAAKALDLQRGDVVQVTQ
jgi:S-adenosylmethionine hydrolase